MHFRLLKWQNETRYIDANVIQFVGCTLSIKCHDDLFVFYFNANILYNLKNTSWSKRLRKQVNNNNNNKKPYPESAILRDGTTAILYFSGLFLRQRRQLFRPQSMLKKGIITNALLSHRDNGLSSEASTTKQNETAILRNPW